MGKKKTEKQPSNSDKVVAYLKESWGQGGDWCLDDIGGHLFTDFDDVPGSVQEAYRRSAMHAFNGASGKLRDIHQELVIPKSYYKGTQKVATWAFATASEEDGKIIDRMRHRKDAMKNGFAGSYDKFMKLVNAKGWLRGGPTPVTS